MVSDAFILKEIARYRDRDIQLLSCTALFFLICQTVSQLYA